MIKHLLASFTGTLLCCSSVLAQSSIDLSNPPAKPELFAPGLVSTSQYERDMAIAPAGDEIYFTMMIPFSSFQTILYTKKKGNKWSSPEVVSFAGRFSDLEPAFSPDGNKLFFASNRPLDITSPDARPKDFDIWYVERLDEGWSQPRNLGAPVNTSGDEFYPSIARNGNLYYTAQYKNGIGKEDIFLAKAIPGGYAEPQVLDSLVNSTVYEFNAYVSPDERFILFSSQGRKDEKGRGDLYISVKDKSGNWQRAQNISQLNSDRLDYCPFVSPDGKTLYFTSESHDLKRFFEKPQLAGELRQQATQIRNGTGNIYQVDIRILQSYFE